MPIQAVSKTAKQWNVTGFEGPESLVFSEQPVPDIGDTQVLVKIQGAAINFRDILVPEGKYPWAVKSNVVPGSDGAGTVLAVGRHVTRFKPGDKVVTIINQQFIAGSMTTQSLNSGLGASLDGTFRTVGAFSEEGLVAMPDSLTFTEAATLSCAGITAWNALFGLVGKQVTAGDWVLTQGTGGVSLFAVQLAKAVGARVIATTSSSEKGDILRKLGADHIINYRETPEWGTAAKALTGGVGVDHVVEVAGTATLKQSVESVKIDGTIAMVGFVGGDGGGQEQIPSLLETWLRNFTARGVWTGSRQHMEEMCRAIEANPDKLRPVVDSRVFKLHELKEAFEYLKQGKHQGKVCIEID
ncbi:putative alcohol dehydrogenase [Stipitochalara longipes BDJ]|nr:putative alcohol dehydrogenase [Stipitochalara longipes BDJ]